jgi:hypothetical protein
VTLQFKPADLLGHGLHVASAHAVMSIGSSLPADRVAVRPDVNVVHRVAESGGERA